MNKQGGKEVLCPPRPSCMTWGSSSPECLITTRQPSRSGLPSSGGESTRGASSSLSKVLPRRRGRSVPGLSWICSITSRPLRRAWSCSGMPGIRRIGNSVSGSSARSRRFCLVVRSGGTSVIWEMGSRVSSGRAPEIPAPNPDPSPARPWGRVSFWAGKTSPIF